MKWTQLIIRFYSLFEWMPLGIGHCASNMIAQLSDELCDRGLPCSQCLLRVICDD